MRVQKGGANAEAEAPNRSRLFPPALARRGVGHGYFGILNLVSDEAGRDLAFVVQGLWKSAVAWLDRLKRLAAVMFRVGKLVQRINAIPIETLERGAYLATIVGVPLLLVSLVVGYIQIHDVAKVSRLQNSISLNTEFFNPTNTGIISALEHRRPILVAHGGSFDDAQLDNYLGDFELIRSAFEQNLLTEDELCTSFSYFATLTANNQEVQGYIEEERKTDSGFYGGFTKIVKVVFRSKNENCH